MKRLNLVFATAIVLLPVPAVPAQIVDHLIPPGYVPEESRDEKGLWMEFEEMESELKRSALLVKDAGLNEYVQGIVCTVADEYCNDFRVYLIRNPGFNASMTATGMMQIWTGLIVRASSTDEIAAVVGHEIAHYTRMHSLQRFRKLRSRMSAGSFFDLGFALLTGVAAPLGQTAALLSYLSFNREQESEADILGTRLLADASYDPHAAYHVWHKLLEEEVAAVVKRENPGIFARTHPNSEVRAQYLKEHVSHRYGATEKEHVVDRTLLDILNANYLFLMEDQLDTNRVGRTQELLARHKNMGVQPGLVDFFYGEMYRQRGEPEDLALAIAAYRQSIESNAAPLEAYKNLGYLFLKKHDLPHARQYFREYLDIDPGASDRAMIEFYLEEDQ